MLQYTVTFFADLPCNHFWSNISMGKITVTYDKTMYTDVNFLALIKYFIINSDGTNKETR